MKEDEKLRKDITIGMKKVMIEEQKKLFWKKTEHLFSYLIGCAVYVCLMAVSGFFVVTMSNVLIQDYDGAILLLIGAFAIFGIFFASFIKFADDEQKKYARLNK